MLIVAVVAMTPSGIDRVVVVTIKTIAIATTATIKRAIEEEGVVVDVVAISGAVTTITTRAFINNSEVGFYFKLWILKIVVLLCRGYTLGFQLL